MFQLQISIRVGGSESTYQPRPGRTISGAAMADISTDFLCLSDILAPFLHGASSAGHFPSESLRLDIVGRKAKRADKCGWLP